MSTKTLEFNTTKTIKLINKDNILKKVYSQKIGKYDYNSLLTASQANKLADETINALEDIFNSIVVPSNTHISLYESLEEAVTLPRRYGKTQIEADIKAQDGKATPLQKTMLNLAKLKAINANLMAKGVSDQFKGSEKLSKNDLRTINAAIRDFEKKVKPFLNKKRG